MRIRCWGARGSIAVSGSEYVVYGGDTTCLELRTASGHVIVVDAGTGVRRLGNALLAEGVREMTMFFTHAHWDHILGFPFFKPVYREDSHITLYGCPMEQGNLELLLAKTMAAPHFPVPYHELKAKIDYTPQCLEQTTTMVHGMQVDSIPLSHPNMGLGYKFTEAGKTMVFLTDNELHHPHHGGRPYAEYVEFCAGADLLLHDAEYTDEEYAHTKGWGHSTMRHALQLALDAKVRQFGMIHHNQDRPDDDLQLREAALRQTVAETAAPLQLFAVTQDMEIRL
ncbi:MBL fold metallo-hydrolase [Megalodesulfovibrio paquesii]